MPAAVHARESPSNRAIALHPWRGVIRVVLLVYALIDSL